MPERVRWAIGWSHIGGGGGDGANLGDGAGVTTLGESARATTLGDVAGSGNGGGVVVMVGGGVGSLKMARRISMARS